VMDSGEVGLQPIASLLKDAVDNASDLRVWRTVENLDTGSKSPIVHIEITDHSLSSYRTSFDHSDRLRPAFCLFWSFVLGHFRVF
jgi:hypothetical protein